MTDDLRALLRADLSAERPPPLGDVVGAAIREGRRIRRNRRRRRFAAGLTMAGLVATAVALIGDGGVAAPAVPVAAAHGLSPGTVPAGMLSPGMVPPGMLSPGNVPLPDAPAPPAVPQARRFSVHSGTRRAGGTPKKATSAAMLHLLLQLLPPGKTSHYAGAADDDLHVQLYLDDGAGPAMVRVSVGRSSAPGDEPSRGDTATVTVTQRPDADVPDTDVPDDGLPTVTAAAEWPDGTVVRVEAAGGLAWDGRQNQPTRPALTEAQAIRIAADPRWGVTMDPALIQAGAAQFGHAPVVAG